MHKPSQNDFRQLYEKVSDWPVPDRLALIQLLVGALQLDREVNGAVPQPQSPRDEPVPRGVPVERILARKVPNFLDDAGVDELRWEHLKEKYLK